MHLLRPYSAHNAILEVFVRPAIGSPRHLLRPARSFATTPTTRQKLTRKQREAGVALTPEDEERIRKAQERAAQRAAKQAQQPVRGNSAQRLLKSLHVNQEAKRDPTAAEKRAKEEEKRAPENEEIFDRSEIIHLIDRESRYHKRVYLSDVLADLDRDVEKLMLVKNNKGEEDDGFPVCKIFSHEHLQARKRRIEGRSAELAKGEKSAKELEMTWTIGPADLDMKLRQMEKFLSEGRKLDLTITRKFKRRVPDKTVAEMEGLIEKLRETVKGVKGAREYKVPDGELAKTIDLYFEGPKGGVKEKVEDTGAEDLIEPEIAGTAAS